MHAIFYDLETSDKNPVGQIINYSFIYVDEQLAQVDELSGLVKLSRLQLPESGAILANRTDVLEHQRAAHDYEPEAMLKISTFIRSCIARAKGAVALVGYNSSRFDLGYLRTSLIRNGLNPYFDQLIVPRDLLHAVHKAYLTSPKFSEAVLKQRGDDKKLSLSLQTVGHALGLLSGEQAHESREDVLLTLKVSVWLRRECDIDPTSFDGYEGVRLHSTARSGTVYFQEQPEYHLDVGRHRVTTPITLLDASNKAGLWIDLERYANKRSPECIMWRSAGKHPFFIIPQASDEPHLKSLARAAIEQFKGINLRNFFKQSKCDIEMDIYRLDFDNLAQYVQAVQSNDKRCLDGCSIPEAKVLWTRRLLANPRALIDDPKTAEMLRQYALYRYGGEMQLARSVSEKEEDNDRDFHPSLSDMMLRLTQSKEAAVISSNKEDQRLLESLERFILDSDIVRVAGEKLLPHYWPNLHKRVESHS